jgi:hypothetical protein
VAIADEDVQHLGRPDPVEDMRAEAGEPFYADLLGYSPRPSARCRSMKWLAAL